MTKRRPIPTADGAFELTGTGKPQMGLRWYRIISVASALVVITCLIFSAYYYWAGDKASYQSLVQSATLIALIFLSMCPLFVKSK